jgi:signal transduction histidine kinase
MDGRKLDSLALAGLVHDLNNVFETIEEAAELIARDGHWSEVAAAVSRSVERGRRLVGSLEGQTRPGCNLQEVVERAADFLRDLVRLLPVPPAEVELRLEPGIRLAGHASDWERVFMNLFLNAAQAMTAGGSIVVSASSANGSAQVQVLDQGSGIPEDVLSEIFHPHFSTRASGGGLGLHIVASIVRGHGGTVSAGNRQDGSGACFVITAPLADAA